MYWSGLRSGLRDTQVDICRNALGKAFRQPYLGPLPARPRRTFLETLVERGEREIEQHHEGEFVLKEIVENVGGGIVAGDNFVERKHRAEIEVRLLAELPVDLVHMAAQLFQQTLQAVEHRIQRGLVSGEVGREQSPRRRQRVAIFGAPELSHLLQSALDSSTLRFAVLGHQFPFQPRDGILHP